MRHRRASAASPLAKLVQRCSKHGKDRDVFGPASALLDFDPPGELEHAAHQAGAESDLEAIRHEVFVDRTGTQRSYHGSASSTPAEAAVDLDGAEVRAALNVCAGAGAAHALRAAG